MPKRKTHIQFRGRKSARTENVLAQLLGRVFANREDPVLLAVGGPGGTGKSTLCRHLARLLPGAEVLRLDDYKTPRAQRQNGNLFGPHPDANDMPTLRCHLEALRNGVSIDRPVYNPATGQADSTAPFPPGRFIILDGEISTYRQFRDLIDFSVFVDSDWKTQLQTRITRDIEDRGYTREKAVATFLHSNLIEFEAFGAESKSWADVHLYCHDDYRLDLESMAKELYEAHGADLDADLAPVGIRGLVVPLPTPFNETYTIDEPALVEHLERLADGGVQRILVNGPVGEGFSLDSEERRTVLALARRYFPGVVLCYAGDSGWGGAVLDVRLAEAYGADAVVLGPPHGHAPDLEAYLSKLLAQTTLPVLHDLTSLDRTEAEHLAGRLAPFAVIAHQSLESLGQSVALFSGTPTPFDGATGFLCPEINLTPERATELERAWESGERETLRQLPPIPAPRAVILKRALAGTFPSFPSTARPPLDG